MTAFKVTIGGLREMGKVVRETADSISRNVELAIKRGAVDVHASTVRSIKRGPKTGKLYGPRDPKTGRRMSPETYQRALDEAEKGEAKKLKGGSHRASAPGEAPASDQGKLATSYKIASEDGKAVAYVYSDSKVSRHLELGTAKIKPRPHLFPSYEEHRPRIEMNVKAAFRNALPKTKPKK